MNTENIKTGGPAFPKTECEKGYMQEGMSIRDYFAAKAMQAIYMRLGGSPSAGKDHDGTLTELAKDAYAMADVMLLARN